MYDPRQHGARCDECPLQGKRVVPPEGRGPVAIVGDSPGKAESEQGRPFTGPAGFKLNELLRRAGLPPRNELLLTNAMLCRPEIPTEEGKKRFDLKGYFAWLRRENGKRRIDGHPPIASPLECCYPRLLKELQDCEAQARALHAQHPSQFPTGAVVFPVGNFALAQTMGVEKRGASVAKYRGSVLKTSVLPDEPEQDVEEGA